MNKELIEELLKMDVHVVAVSKKHSKEEVDTVAAMGLTTFGENRVQEFLEKYDSKYSWHIIGHLQTNKVKYILGKVDLIESVDSLKLVQEIEKQAKKLNLVQNILVEVKISDDPNKTGLPYNQVWDLLKALESCSHICVKGLMCIASHTEDQAKIIHEFDTMKNLYDQAKVKYPTMDTLSMGMSQDYKLAIEHGSNTVRIGTAIVGKPL